MPHQGRSKKNTGFSLLDNWVHTLSSESSLLSNCSPPSSQSKNSNKHISRSQVSEEKQELKKQRYENKKFSAW